VALGTRFQVALGAQDVTVTLAEGSVAVSMQGVGGFTEVLRPGEQLQMSTDRGDRKRHDVDTDMVLGWSSSRLVFRGAQLAEVLDEINRYATVKLRLGDDSLRDTPVGGTFTAGADSAQVAAALAAALPLNAVQVGSSEIVLFRRYEAAD
jgi:transmembrane sensor